MDTTLIPGAAPRPALLLDGPSRLRPWAPVGVDVPVAQETSALVPAALVTAGPVPVSPIPAGYATGTAGSAVTAATACSAFSAAGHDALVMAGLAVLPRNDAKGPSSRGTPV